MAEYNPISNENLKRLIAFVFISLGIIFGYFLGWQYLMEDRLKIGFIFLAMGIYFLSSLLWMFRSMNHLYIATAIPFVFIVGSYLIFMWRT